MLPTHTSSKVMAHILEAVGHSAVLANLMDALWYVSSTLESLLNNPVLSQTVFSEFIHLAYFFLWLLHHKPIDFQFFASACLSAKPSPFTPVKFSVTPDELGQLTERKCK